MKERKNTRQSRTPNLQRTFEVCLPEQVVQDLPTKLRCLKVIAIPIRDMTFCSVNPKGSGIGEFASTFPSSLTSSFSSTRPGYQRSRTFLQIYHQTPSVK